MVDEKYQVMPPLSDEEYQELKADIRERGVLSPIEFDEDGNVLDGHHRLMICEELGITDYPRVIRTGMSESEKITHARKMNMLRRHLSREQKADIIRAAIKATPTRSNRELSQELGVSDKTIAAQRAKMEAEGEIKSTDDMIRDAITSDPTRSDRQIAQDLGLSHQTVGRVRAGMAAGPNAENPKMDHRRPVSVFNPSPRQMRALRDPRVVEVMTVTGSSDPLKAKREIYVEKKASRKHYELPAELPADALKLYAEDIREGHSEVDDASVDFVITRPPAGRANVHLMAELALISSRVLRDGGSLLAICDQAHLPDDYMILGSALDYCWTCLLELPDSRPATEGRKATTSWRPILWYVKGTYNGDYIGDVIKSIDELIYKFTDPGHLIVDPFMGDGIIGSAAVTTGRRFIGSDIDAERIDAAREKILREYAGAARAAGLPDQ